MKCFECDRVDKNIIGALIYNCVNLKNLKLTCGSQIVGIDRAFSQLFKKNRNLKILKLHGFENLTGKCFVDLEENNVEEITLDTTDTIKNNYYLINELPTSVFLKIFQPKV